MAVFTPVTLEHLQEWIKQYPLGAAREIRGIASGIENSNFFIRTEAAEYVLTIFENLNFEQLPFYLHLMRHLSSRGVLVPAPVLTNVGEILSSLHGKPACIVSKLEGQSQMQPQAVHCAATGHMMAQMHLAGRDYPLHQANLRGLPWMEETVPKVLPFLDEDKAHLLRAEIHFQTTFAASEAYHHLPRGPIHADLFRNNVMFVDTLLSGFFDFYFAGVDTWLFDIAVTVNDWCIDLATGVLDQERAKAMLTAYANVRPFTTQEHAAWQPMLRAAALRFWLSRLFDFYLPRAAEMLTAHDPGHFERILRLRISDVAPTLPEPSV